MFILLNGPQSITLKLKGEWKERNRQRYQLPIYPMHRVSVFVKFHENQTHFEATRALMMRQMGRQTDKGNTICIKKEQTVLHFYHNQSDMILPEAPTIIDL